MRKAASQPPNELLFERRLNPPLHVRLIVRQATSEKPSCINSKEKVKIEMSLLTSALPFVVPCRQCAPATVYPPKSENTCLK